MKKPSPAMVVACIALFVALGGIGYAAVKLPANSVGTKQLKKNAVSSSKIRNGAVTSTKIGADQVTGQQVAEATLGQVPSAADAATLAGLAPSAFARSDRFIFGSGDSTASPAQTVVQVANLVRVATDGDPDFNFDIAFFNPNSTDSVQLSSPQGRTTLGPNGGITLNLSDAPAVFFVQDQAHQERSVLLECGSSGWYAAPTAYGSIVCFGALSPSA